MVPGHLSSLTWDDIAKLVETRRQEDDTIEFKRQFSNGEDFAALLDKSREQSVDAIAREAIAFLNTRGGDVLIGVAESEGGGRASKIPGVCNPADAAERLLRSLAAVIEPTQTALTARGLEDPNQPGRGVIILRAQASIRAPHRSKRDNKCYVRRGTECVPISMDEIQDLSVRRYQLRTEQLAALKQQFDDFRDGRYEHLNIRNHSIHMRAVLFPLREAVLEIDDRLLKALEDNNSIFYPPSGLGTCEPVFGRLHGSWIPILRGRKREHIDRNSGPSGRGFTLTSKRLKENGVAMFDYAQSVEEPDTISFKQFVGFLCNVCRNVSTLTHAAPALLPAVLRLGVRSAGNVRLKFGGPDVFPEERRVPDHLWLLPDFPVDTPDDQNSFFRQAQVDLASIVEFSPGQFTLQPQL